MKLLRIKDNSQQKKDAFSQVAKLTGKIADKTLEQLEREGVFVFPEKTYFAKLLHQKSFLESFGEDVHAVLVKRYGSLPGLEDGKTHQ